MYDYDVELVKEILRAIITSTLTQRSYMPPATSKLKNFPKQFNRCLWT